MSKEYENKLIGSIWEKEKDGKTYFDGKIKGEKVVMFKNKKKKRENSPDYFVFKPKEIDEREETYKSAKKEASNLMKEN